MGKLNLDALRAEAENTPHEVTLGGRVYLFKPRMPLEFTERLNEGRMTEAIKLLLVDPDEWEAMRVAVPDDRDLLAISELYAVDMGESQASQRSSLNGNGSSRPISPATTASVSPMPASARGKSGSAGSKP